MPGLSRRVWPVEDPLNGFKWKRQGTEQKPPSFVEWHLEVLKDSIYTSALALKTTLRFNLDWPPKAIKDIFEPNRFSPQQWNSSTLPPAVLIAPSASARHHISQPPGNRPGTTLNSLLNEEEVDPTPKRRRLQHC